MPVEKLRLTCLVWPHGHSLEVELDNDRSVLFLRQFIREIHGDVLAHVSPCDITIWRCSIPDDDNLRHNFKKIRFDGTDPSVQCLHLTSEISEYFTTNLPRRTIHVIAELPESALGECVSPFH